MRGEYVRYIAKVAYDGTAYCGWQAQSHCDTVAGVLKSRFRDAFGRDVTLVGASRTDTGVHALGQIALVTTDFDLSFEVLHRVWNEHIPEDIVIRTLIPAPENFHPLRDVEQKTYYYHFFTERPLPFVARYGTYIKYPVDKDCLNEGLQVFVGTHDFRSFCTGDYDNTVRRIDNILLVYHAAYRMYRIIVRGPSFLHHMIRRIVGAALDVASRPKHTIELLKQALDEKNPQQQLPNAPPKGLVLRSIDYRNLII